MCKPVFINFLYQQTTFERWYEDHANEVMRNACFAVISNTNAVTLQPYLQIVQDISLYTGCPRRNVPDFGRVFLMFNYTDITQNTYIQS